MATCCLPIRHWILPRKGFLLVQIVLKVLNKLKNNIYKSKGVVWSGMSTLWPHWAPPEERSTLIGIGNAGSQIGNV